MKKLFLCLMSLLVLAIGFSPVHAKDEIVLTDLGYYDEENGYYITKAWRTTENGIEEVDLREFIKFKKENDEKLKELEEMMQQEYADVQDADYGTNAIEYAFRVTRESKGVYGGAEKVSQDYGCYSPATECTQRVSFSATKSETFSANVTSSWKSLIKGVVSYTWHETASVSGSDSVTFPANHYAYYMFMPKQNVVDGQIIRYRDGMETGRENVWANSPVKLSSGLLDGYGYHVVRPIAP